jgi:hypothetical protein
MELVREVWNRLSEWEGKWLATLLLTLAISFPTGLAYFLIDFRTGRYQGYEIVYYFAVAACLGGSTFFIWVVAHPIKDTIDLAVVANLALEKRKRNHLTLLVKEFVAGLRKGIDNPQVQATNLLVFLLDLRKEERSRGKAIRKANAWLANMDQRDTKLPEGVSVKFGMLTHNNVVKWLVKDYTGPVYPGNFDLWLVVYRSWLAVKIFYLDSRSCGKATLVWSHPEVTIEVAK